MQELVFEHFCSQEPEEVDDGIKTTKTKEIIEKRYVIMSLKYETFTEGKEGKLQIQQDIKLTREGKAYTLKAACMKSGDTQSGHWTCLVKNDQDQDQESSRAFLLYDDLEWKNETPEQKFDYINDNGESIATLQCYEQK